MLCSKRLFRFLLSWVTSESTYKTARGGLIFQVNGELKDFVTFSGVSFAEVLDINREKVVLTFRRRRTTAGQGRKVLIGTVDFSNIHRIVEQTIDRKSEQFLVWRLVMKKFE
ncbi:uncharacterized protein [Physcomitrium patens]|uniref:uncharacterized protein isoform X2 n=1 Tax=Physcomitrium patens TaxID=3218 RepID=UPI003CCDF68E